MLLALNSARCTGLIARLFATALVLLTLSALPISAQDAPARNKRLLGYYTAWSKYNTPPYAASQIPYSKLTHIAHAFVLLTGKADGTLRIPSGTIEPAQQDNLNFAVSGQVTAVNVTAGAQVTSGQALATVNSPYGIPSPGNYAGFQTGGANANYFTSYAASEGDTSDSTAQIFGCGGTLAANPTLCAGLNRHVAQLPAAQQTNPANFYQAAPANYYAQFWHQNAINGVQYGFPYDDDAGQSSDISLTNPQYAVVAVGW